MTGLALAGRVAVVVGGTSGIGLALSQGLAAAGADVVPVSRRTAMVDEAASTIEALGRRSLRVCADALDRAALETALSETMAAFSRLDILGASEPRCA